MLSEEQCRQWIEQHIDESAALRGIRETIDRKGLPHLELFLSQLALLRTLLLVADAHHILELGTFVGYSTQSLVEILEDCGSGSVTTVDSDGEAVSLAKLAVQSTKIEVNYIVGTAEEACDALLDNGRTFDAVLLDVAESAYLRLYDRCVTLLKPGGLLVIDNVLMETVAGWADGKNVVEDAEGKVASVLAELNTLAFADERVATSVIPLGSGMALCSRRK